MLDVGLIIRREQKGAQVGIAVIPGVVPACTSFLYRLQSIRQVVEEQRNKELKEGLFSFGNRGYHIGRCHFCIREMVKSDF